MAPTLWHQHLQHHQTEHRSITGLRPLHLTIDPKFLGVHIMDDLFWTLNCTSIIKRTLQCLHLLWSLKRVSLPPQILNTFYRRTIESLLYSCVTVWYGMFQTLITLQQIERAAENVICVPLLTLKNIYQTRCYNRA